jgi:hypothetical protein
VPRSPRIHSLSRVGPGRYPKLNLRGAGSSLLIEDCNCPTDNPIDGIPNECARDTIPRIAGYPRGQTAPTPAQIDVKPGELLGCASGAIVIDDCGNRFGLS